MTPDPNNLRVGAGNVYFDRFDADGNSTGLRHLGNVETHTIATTVEKLSKKSSMSGKRGLLKEVTIGQEAEVTLVLSEYDAENLALAFRGDTAAFTQAGAWGLDAQPINGGLALKFDNWYELGKRSVLNVVIKQGGSPLTLGDDYELKAEQGWVRILSTGSGTEAVTTWEGDASPLSSTMIRGLVSSSVKGSLRHIDAVDQVSGKRYDVDVPIIELSPDGDLPLIGEEFSSFTLKGKIQEDITQPEGQEFFTLTEITAAETGS